MALIAPLTLQFYLISRDCAKSEFSVKTVSACSKIHQDAQEWQMGAEAGSGDFPFPAWEEQSSRSCQCLSCSRTHSWKGRATSAGPGASQGGKWTFSSPWGHPHSLPMTYMKGGHSQTRGCCTESCYQQVICSGSNYLNIFTGDEGNEGARKRGMGGKSSFSNCNEVIKKIQETRTLLCTVSLPLPPTGFISFYKGALGRLFIFDHSGINLQMYKLPLNPCLPTVKLHITPWFLKASGRCKLETKRRGMISVRHCRDCLKRAAGPHPD